MMLTIFILAFIGVLVLADAVKRETNTPQHVRDARAAARQAKREQANFARTLAKEMVKEQKRQGVTVR